MHDTIAYHKWNERFIRNVRLPGDGVWKDNANADELEREAEEKQIFYCPQIVGGEGAQSLDYKCV